MVPPLPSDESLEKMEPGEHHGVKWFMIKRGIPMEMTESQNHRSSIQFISLPKVSERHLWYMGVNSLAKSSNDIIIFQGSSFRHLRWCWDSRLLLLLGACRVKPRSQEGKEKECAQMSSTAISIDFTWG